MPETANTVIGYVVDVQGHMLTASLVEDDQGRAPTVTIGDEDILVGQIGSYIAIRQNDVNIVAIVTRMTDYASDCRDQENLPVHASASHSAMSLHWSVMRCINHFARFVK